MTLKWLPLLIWLPLAAVAKPCNPKKPGFYNKHCLKPDQSFDNQAPCDPKKPGFYNQNCQKPAPKPAQEPTKKLISPQRVLPQKAGPNGRPSLLEHLKDRPPPKQPLSNQAPQPKSDDESDWNWMQ